MDDRDFLRDYDGPRLRIMEVCGTHTAAIFKNGIRSLISPKLRLVSGPGCPVCVTVPSYIDRCVEICMQPDHELLCFGDLLKVPGTEMTLSDAKSAGGRVRMVWSPFDALTHAEREPGTVFVVAAIGFETTAPAFALLFEEAKARGVRNIKLMTSLKSALVAIDWICAMGEAVDAFLCPGHVSVITGADAYLPFAEKYGKPFIVAGFEGEHLLAAIRAAAEDANEGRGGVRNLYPEAVSAAGNVRARAITERYFEPGDEAWRGLGTVANSGYFLRKEFRGYDVSNGDGLILSQVSNGDGSAVVDCVADRRTVPILSREDMLPEGCRCGDVILGRIDPNECPVFGTACTPSQPVGPCMVSSEGACGIWYRNRPI